MDDVVQTPGRSCGTCTACCKTHGIHEEIQKLAGEWCVHCNRGRGCKIYETRPTPCRVYQCGWLEGFWGEQDRPDRRKILIDSHETPREKLSYICIWEVREGEIERAYAQTKKRFYLNRGLCVVLVRLSGKRTVIFPPSVPFKQEIKDDFLALGITHLQRVNLLAKS